MTNNLLFKIILISFNILYSFMRYVVIVILMVVLWLGSYGQKKRDNTILVDTSMSIQRLKMILFNNGYTVANSDTQFIVTQEKTVTGAVTMRIQAAITDTGIILKAQQKMLVEMVLFGSPIKNDFEPVFAWYIKSSPYSDTWKELDRISKEMGSRRRYYKL